MNIQVAKVSVGTGDMVLSATLPAVQLVTLEPAIKKEFPDSRPGFGPHKAIEFNVTLGRSISTRDLIFELLGRDAKLIFMFNILVDQVNSEKDAPINNKAILLTESNNKARDVNYKQSRRERTTQQDDLHGAGLEFADSMQAAIVCATLVRKAKDAGLDLSKKAKTWRKEQSQALRKLDPLEIVLLTKLREGEIRTSPAALFVNADGCLSASIIHHFKGANLWAFGGVSPAE